jgi:hypothetical protein
VSEDGANTGRRVRIVLDEADALFVAEVLRMRARYNRSGMGQMPPDHPCRKAAENYERLAALVEDWEAT